MEMKLDTLKNAPSREKPRPLGRRLKWIIPLAALLLIGGVGGAAVGTSYFTLNGNAEVQVVLGEPYNDKGCEAGVLGSRLNHRIRMEGTVDTGKVGTYTLTYRLDGLPWSRPLTRTVTVADISIPELLLSDGENLTLALNAPYAEPGYTATDNYDGDLTAAVRVEGTVDTSRAGEYTLTYAVADSSGNEARAARTVTVLASSPLTMGLAEFTLNDYFPDVILGETPDAGDDYISSTVFIGDSITENGLGWGFFPYHGVWAMHAIQPDTIQTDPVMVYGTEDGDQEMLAVDAARQYKPERVIINIGSNCVFKMKPDEFAGHYRDFLRSLRAASPDTQIIVCSVLPVDKRYDESEKSAYTTNNDKCNKINYALAQLCREDGYKFLNLAEALKDGNGQAAEGLLYETDGIHPNKSTYPRMLEYIRTHAWTA